MKNIWNQDQDKSSWYAMPYLVLPTIVAFALSATLKIGPDGSPPVLAFIVLISFSLPHFLLSFSNENISSILQKGKKREIFISIVLIVFLILNLLFNTSKYKNLVFIIFSSYQSWHYSMQNYGIYKYFQKPDIRYKKFIKFAFILMGFFFFKNLSLLYLSLIKDAFLYNKLAAFQAPLLNEMFLLLITMAVALYISSLNKKLSLMASYTGLLWAIWAAMAIVPVFYFLLPALHSLQYLYFIRLKTNERRLKFFPLLICSFVLFVSILASHYYNYTRVIEYLLTFILVLNSLHILIDSQSWKFLND